MSGLFARTPWTKIFSYDADVTMVTDSRGRGKTFGMRQQFFRDAMQGYTFVQIVRHESRIKQVASGYFDALFKLDATGQPTSEVVRGRHWAFTRRGHDYLWQEIPEEALDDPKYKPKVSKWERMGYFVSLSKAQDYKELTFANVRRLCLDEALIQYPNGHHNYLPLEFDQLISIVDSCTREQPGDGRHKPNVYLLSNACSIVNPYFQHYGITSLPPDGFSWWGDKTFLLYVGHDTGYAEAKATGTVAGRMSARTQTASIANDNSFITARTNLIRHKTSDAKFNFGMVCNGQRYGVWLDLWEGLYFVTAKIPRDAKPIYALTTSDNSVNYIVARRSEPLIKSLVDMYSMGLVRFDTPVIRERCETEVFRMYGMR